ncbi:helix-turn-helix transcriptional regulator [Streptomyces olivaceoviridis]|uniref:helix-turn-helix transcriptional regulator n=1 Tax=Streptomyces olivaceoviridis TaxID=1921 RepID=UPI00333267CA
MRWCNSSYTCCAKVEEHGWGASPRVVFFTHRTVSPGGFRRRGAVSTLSDYGVLSLQLTGQGCMDHVSSLVHLRASVVEGTLVKRPALPPLPAAESTDAPGPASAVQAAHGAPRTGAHRLVGRDEEIRLIVERLDGLCSAGPAGSALIIEGDAGIGKSSLLDLAVQHGAASGVRVLRCTGLQAASPLGYTGLHELLHPLMPLVDDLPPRQRAALLTAFALDEGATPDRLLVGLSALGLLEEAARNQPLLVAVEDLQWLDHSSVHVLNFIGLRVSAAPITLLATLRSDGDADALPPLPIERLRLGPLAEDAARALLDDVAADLRPASRGRILSESSGNPLALHELPTALRQHGIERTTLHAHLPITKRLERAFLDQLQPLPAASRSLLVLAAASDGAQLQDIMAAARRLGLGVEALSPLEERGLVSVGDSGLRFRHPLLRSAVHSAARTSEWVEAHLALAAVTAGQDRAVWHRAAAALEWDETVAGELEGVAARAHDRGAQPEAMSAYRRAATLTQDARERARRLALAAEAARSAGMTAEALELLEQVGPLSPASGAETITQVALIRTILSLTAAAPAPSSNDFEEILGLLPVPEENERRVIILWGAAVLTRGRNLPSADWDYLRRNLEATRTSSPLKPAALAILAPGGQAAAMRDQLPSLIPQLAEFPLGMLSLAIAAESLQDLQTSLTCWELSRERSHNQGSPADELQALRGKANVLLLRGQLREGLAAAEYSERMAADTQQQMIGSFAVATAARAHALLGDLDAATAAIRRSRELSRMAPLAMISADLRWAAGLIASQRGRHRDALIEFTHVAVHSTRALWTIADRTEAAVRAGRADQVRDNVDAADEAARAYQSSYLAALVARSRALLAGDDEAAGEEFEKSVAAGAVEESRLEVARSRLLYGQWLRRRRSQAAAREQLALALTEFDAIGARGYADRAAGELRAAGETPHRAPGHSWAHEKLTAQELQVARLAAKGMSNKEIADSIYLSHRTVSSHLYRVYPKLGITSRAQLAAALQDSGDDL